MTHGKGREFKKLPPLTLDNIKDGHLQLLLFEAERAWAYSQELLEDSSKPENSAHAATLRHSATGRFRRAVQWSTELLSHCQTLHSAQRLSASALLEASVYTLILNGRFLRHRDEFEDALVQLSAARNLLDELASRAATSRDQALATVFADEISPEIRYCAHEMGRSGSYDVDAIVKELGPKHRAELVEDCESLVAQLESEAEVAGKGQARRQLLEIVWEGEPVPIRSPELVDVLLRVQEAEAKLRESQKENTQPVKREKAEKGKRRKVGKGGRSKRGVAAYDVILLALSDAEEVARKLVEAQQLSGTGTSAAVAGTRDIHFVHAYIVYQLLSRRIQRDLLLISALLSSQNHPQHGAQRKTVPASSKSKNEQVDARLYPAVVKVLDTVLQSLEQMRTLSIVDESPDLATAVEARILFTKARRCLFLSRSYAAVKKYAESLALIRHAQIHLREARSLMSTAGSDPISFGSPDFSPAEAVDKLDTELASDGLKFKKAWFAFNGGQIDPESSKTYKKPLFFDIALNYVQLDMDRLQARAGKQPAAPAAKAAPSAVPEKKAPARAKVEEIERAATPEPQAAPSRGGLSSLLGGWWGRS